MPGDRLVVCYHAVSANWPERYCVRPDSLDAQVRGLLARGYDAVTFAEAVSAGPDERVVAITFDDAYRSVRDRALPLLERLGVRATVFAVSNWAAVGGDVEVALGHWRGTAHEHELRSMLWDELRTLADDYGWEIGSHTCSHPMLTLLSDDELAAELRCSRLACEEGVGRPCTSIAYPFGDFDARVIDAAERAGYEQAATLFGGAPGRPDPLGWPRVAINRGHGARAFRLKTAHAVRRARTSRVVSAALDAAMRLTGRTPASRPAGNAA